ncbi:MAG: outer membrane protein assembly factor BamE [Zoogloeaceae bacterium]|nr:outer membrane protein assembly factor BamE [Zoogloeaceae bacterium]
MAEKSPLPFLARLSRFSLIALAGALLAACSYMPRIVTEYRIDVQQGNVLTQEMVSQLRPGLTREQVRFILGTPMLADTFHADRWDYLFRLEKGKTGEVTMRSLAVYFNADGLLERIEGDVETGSVAELTETVARTQVVDLGSVAPGEQPLPPEESKGFWGRMMETLGW